MEHPLETNSSLHKHLPVLGVLGRRLFLAVLKFFGVFWLARRWSAGKLRIIAWQGLSSSDEHEYDDATFLRPQTFARRLELLAHMGATVLPLDEAMDRLARGTLPALPVVLTIDGGWASSAGPMADALSRAGFPATLYVATDSTRRPFWPVYEVAVGWLLWRAGQTGRQAPVDLAPVDPRAGTLDLSTEAQRQEALAKLRALGPSLNLVERTHLVTALAEALGEDLGSAALQSADYDALGTLAARGVDVQLHTHRRRMPPTEAQLSAELDLNRAHLRRASPRSLKHLSFPEGEYRPEQLDWLPRLGVSTAVTRKPGLNDARTPRLELRRFVDRERLSALELEATLCGVPEYLRSLRARRNPALRPVGAQTT